MPIDNPAIEIKNLVVEYAHKRVLDGLNLRVEKGHVYGFIGPNGAGKSTTIKSMLGLLAPRSGEVFLNGIAAANHQARARVGFVPEETTYYKYLTPREILKFYGDICLVESRLLRERTQTLLKLVGLSEAQNKRLSTFSKGMVQKVSLAQCLIHDPEILILDEPMSGLDPMARLDLRHMLKDLKDRGKTIFFSSHELSEVELLCDHIAIIKQGHILKQGSVDQVLGGKKENLEQFFIETVRGKNV